MPKGLIGNHTTFDYFNQTVFRRNGIHGGNNLTIELAELWTVGSKNCRDSLRSVESNVAAMTLSKLITRFSLVVLLLSANIANVFDPKTKTYTFFVRPSRYRFVLFDSKNDYKVYEINQLFPFSKSSTYFGGTYPPDYPGPWDKLPK